MGFKNKQCPPETIENKLLNTKYNWNCIKKISPEPLRRKL